MTLLFCIIIVIEIWIDVIQIKMEDCSFCANCQKKQVTGIDKDLPGYIIKEEIAK